MDIQRIDSTKKKRQRRWLVGGAVTLALGVLVFALANDPGIPRVERDSLWLGTVERGDLLLEVRGPGLLLPSQARWIAAETTARVDRILLKPGAPVEADSVILELTNPEVVEAELAAQSALAAAEAELAAQRMTLESQRLDQKASLASVEAEYESARLQAEADGELAARGITSKIQYRRSQLMLDQLKVRLDIERQRSASFAQTITAQLAAQRARVALLRGTAELRAGQRESLKVRAAIAGVLQQVPVEEGQQVAAGTSLARVAQTDQLMAQLRIPETQMKDVNLGQEVDVDTRNGVVRGRLVRIDPAVQGGTVLVDVGFDGELPLGVRPDLGVDGIIRIEHLAEVLQVGRPAYSQPETEAYLFKLEPNSNTARRVPVRLGRASTSRIEVRQGLQAGDVVVLSDVSAWTNHDRLRIE